MEDYWIYYLKLHPFHQLKMMDSRNLLVVRGSHLKLFVNNSWLKKTLSVREQERSIKKKGKKKKKKREERVSYKGTWESARNEMPFEGGIHE